MNYVNLNKTIIVNHTINGSIIIPIMPAIKYMFSLMPWKTVLQARQR